MKKIQTGDDDAIDDSRGRKDDERYVIPHCIVCRVQCTCTHAVSLDQLPSLTDYVVSEIRKLMTRNLSIMSLLL